MDKTKTLFKATLLSFLWVSFKVKMVKHSKMGIEKDERFFHALLLHVPNIQNKKNSEGIQDKISKLIERIKIKYTRTSNVRYKNLIYHEDALELIHGN